MQKIKISSDIDFNFLLSISDFKSILAYLATIKDFDISIELSEAGFIQIMDLKIKVYSIDTSDFPIFNSPNLDERHIFSMDTENFLKISQEHMLFASKDKDNKKLTGVFVKIENGDVETVSTDGHKLLLQKPENCRSYDNTNISFIIPTSILLIANKIKICGVVKMHKADNNLAFVFCGGDFRGNSIIITGRVPEGTYPDFTTVLPAADAKKIKINRKEFLGNIELASIMTPDKSNSNGITINFNGSINFKDTDKKMEYAGNDIFDETEIKLNANYLKDGLKVLTDEYINIALKTKYTPFSISNDSSNQIAVMMPMRY